MVNSFTGLSSLELFTGAGGLALGVASAGFSHLGLVELNEHACHSLRANSRRIRLMRGWPIFEQDARTFDFRTYSGKVTLIAAGAPCQPWSLGGKHAGHADDRNLFPVVFRAAHETHAPVVVIENVKGLLRSSFSDYFEYISLALSAPDMFSDKGEHWTAHKARLKKLEAKGQLSGQRYIVTHQLLNAADYGVPQKRERVFIVALRSDLGISWKPLVPTHSEDALLYAKWVSGEYWAEHRLRAPKTPDDVLARVRRIGGQLGLWKERRWRTVRDALAGLPTPKDHVPHPLFLNHAGNPGARSYAGHTGSPWDVPAKTLKAGDHGVPGGENTLRMDDGSVRYFSVREAARLQGFPDAYEFQGAWSEGFRQLGNAVPVDLAATVARHVRKLLQDVSTETHGETFVSARESERVA